MSCWTCLFRKPYFLVSMLDFSALELSSHDFGSEIVTKNDAQVWLIWSHT